MAGEKRTDPLASLAEATTELAGQLEDVRDSLEGSTRAQERRTNTLRRLAGSATAMAVLATGGAVAALVLLMGAIGDLGDQQTQLADQQRQLDAKVVADCGFHRDMAGLPTAVASVLAARSLAPPGWTAGPVIQALAADSVEAYGRAGCAGHLGPLPRAPRPTPSPSG